MIVLIRLRGFRQPQLRAEDGGLRLFALNPIRWRQGSRLTVAPPPGVFCPASFYSGRSCRTVPRLSEAGRRQKAHCGGNSATCKMPLSIGSRLKERRGRRPEKPAGQAGITRGMNSKTGRECVCRWMVRVSAISCSKAGLLQHGGHRKQPAIGGQIVCFKVIARRSPNFIWLRKHCRNSLIDPPPRRYADLHCSPFGGLLEISLRSS
jgi:hypothetical protein